MKKIIFSVITIILLLLFIFNKINKNSLRSNFKKNLRNNITYNILESNKEEYNYNQRGYYINNKDDNKILITISSGMKNTGGFGIDIEDIKINNKNVKIYVKETKPTDNRKVSQIINYPIVQVELSEMPDSLIIKNINNNSIYNKINN